MFRKLFFKLILALISGICMGMTAAPFEFWYLAWVAIIPLWFLIVQSIPPSPPSKGGNLSRVKYPFSQFKNSLKISRQLLLNYREPLLISLCWGLGYQGLTLFWITGIHPMTWMGIPWLWSLLIAAICWVIITVWGMGIPLLWTVGMLLYQKITGTPKNPPWQAQLRRIFYGSALWCVVEYLWSQTDLFWHFLAFSQSPHNLVILQLTKLSGFTTVSLVIALVNGCLAEFLINYISGDKRKTWLITGITILISCHLFGWSLLQIHSETSTKTAKVGIIQGNIPNDIKLYTDGGRQAIANYSQGYQTLAKAGVDLIVTPETALPFRIETILGSTNFYPLIKAEKVPIILGAFGTENHNFTNSLFTLDAQGNVLSRYNKQRLVPLGEYIPFEKIIGKIIDRLSPLDAHLVRGQNPPLLNTPIGQAIAAICYESAYPEHFRRQTKAGGELIIVASNDAHYSPTMPAQHHALDVMQAIANDRWTVRATNTGHSAFVSPTGQTLWISQLNQLVTHQETIQLRNTQTPYVRWGNWLVKGCLIMLLILIGYGNLQRNKTETVPKNLNKL